ncbi:hypothetical protein ACIPPS_15640 [Streptomyces sp. NPDC090127]|uniref:hypothetical protein n=1 Tax=Streptomyces sp. NPDC090127 TaxID=3365953 RepID=UPI00381B1399
MSARTHTRTPSPSVGGVDTRLPWWALVLPVAAFVALFLLIAGPGGPPAGPGDPTVGRLLEQIQQSLPR